MSAKPKTIDGLMRHMRNNNNLEINGSKQKGQLRNIGYFHGYKGYNFYLDNSHKLNFTDFEELHSLYEFDTELKALFYKHVMYSETAIKNRVLEIVMQVSGYDLDNIFNKSLTYYKMFQPGSSQYNKKLKNTTRLRKDIYEMIHNHCNSKPYIYHYIHNDRPVPIYAVFELFTLGNLVFFTRCMNNSLVISTLIDLNLYHSSFNQSIDISGDIIDELKGLRNAIAHNGVLYDCRFKTSTTSNRLENYIKIHMGINNVKFNKIIDYLILVILICSGLSYSKTELRKIVRHFENYLNELRNNCTQSVYDRINGAHARPKLKELKIFIDNLA
ncbi:Abi family protein [Mammaliicoccus vitulinus]|uniref:Abi family protein n=1 Tax=Mammaliicoccus vitulinus TaxID=71237 RepID=UPI000D1D22E4|nr:Abi family protein [Mammaliicoccus vitulinus]PTI83430.1 CAAX protease [Mammaliicoccus vitulinus]